MAVQYGNTMVRNPNTCKDYCKGQGVDLTKDIKFTNQKYGRVHGVNRVFGPPQMTTALLDMPLKTLPIFGHLACSRAETSCAIVDDAHDGGHTSACESASEGDGEANSGAGVDGGTDTANDEDETNSPLMHLDKWPANIGHADRPQISEYNRGAYAGYAQVPLYQPPYETMPDRAYAKPYGMPYSPPVSAPQPQQLGTAWNGPLENVMPTQQPQRRAEECAADSRSHTPGCVSIHSSNHAKQRTPEDNASHREFFKADDQQKKKWCAGSKTTIISRTVAVDTPARRLDGRPRQPHAHWPLLNAW